jgi:hypothetical protein
MFPVNYLPPEQMPSHQRDFPRTNEIARRADGSQELGLLVILYLVAMLGGIVLLGLFTTTTGPSMTSASASRPI